MTAETALMTALAAAFAVWIGGAFADALHLPWAEILADAPEGP